MLSTMKGYILLILFLLLLLIFIPFLLPNGGVGGDFTSYLKIASELPQLKDNLFPIGFPFILKIFSLITGEYFYSSMIVKVICFLSIILFSYKKQFYFKETVFLMCIKSIIWMFTLQSSEYVGLPFLYLYIYYTHEFLKSKISTKKYIIIASCLGIILCTIRYANALLFISTIPFILLYFKKLKPKNKGLFFSTTLIGIGLISYLLINYIVIGSFTGENRRINDEMDTFWFDTYVDFIGVINLSNPIFYIKTFDYSSNIKFLLSLLLISIDLLWWFICFKLIRKSKDVFTHFLIFIAVSNALLTFLSAMIQGIEPLGIRLLFNSSYLFWFALLIIIRKNNIISDKTIFIISLVALILNSLIIVKNPTNFIYHKNNLEQFIKSKKHEPSYYYDDEKKEVESIYQIPFTDKKFKHVHENRQPDFINRAILRVINPSIIILEDQPKIKDNTIIYSSDISHFEEQKNSR